MASDIETLKKNLIELKECSDTILKIQKYKILLVLSQTSTTLAHICTKSNSYENGMITDILQKHEVCKLLCILMKSTDKFIKYSSLKLTCKLFHHFPNLLPMECIVKELFHIVNLDCINGLLKVSLIKTKHESDCETVRLYLDFFGYCVDATVSCLNKPLNEMTKNILDLLYTIVLLFKIYQKTESYINKETSINFCHLVFAFQDLIIQMSTNANLPYHFTEKSQIIWLYLSKILLKLADISLNMDSINSTTFQSVAYKLAQIFIIAEKQKSVVILPSSFHGINNSSYFKYLFAMNECSARKLVLFQLETLYLYYCTKRREGKVLSG